MLKFIHKDICYLYDTCEGNANTVLYIERIAEITDSLTNEVQLKENPIRANHGLKSALKKNRESYNERVSSSNSRDSERLTMLNTKRNELISLKRKTLVLMNKLMNNKQANVDNSSDFEDWKRAPQKLEPQKVCFSGYVRSQNLKKCHPKDVGSNHKYLNRDYY